MRFTLPQAMAINKNSGKRCSTFFEQLLFGSFSFGKRSSSPRRERWWNAIFARKCLTASVTLNK
jgi:hypothetical protein